MIRNDLREIFTDSLRETHFPVGYFLLVASEKTSTMRIPPRTNPGTNPPRKRYPTDAPESME